MAHIVLLGDSIFDNAAYVSPGQDVSAQLGARLGAGHQVSLLAVDGSVLADMPAQFARLERLPTPPDWLVLSCGGNDVLGLVGAMQSPASTVLAAAELLAAWQADFRRNYQAMLALAQAAARPFAVATIYDGVPGLGPGLRAALAPFNDVILREAALRRLPVVDLRVICDEAADYAGASPIEPSAQGGGKIGAAIAQLVRGHDPAAPGALLYGSPGAA